MSLRPFVFIGLGGSGGKMLSVVHETLKQNLDRIGIHSWPAGWQMLHLDVPCNPDSPAEGMPGSLPRKMYVPMTGPHTNYSAVHQVISSSLNGTPLQKYLAWDSWRPTNPQEVQVNLPDGAGQSRAIGRVALHGALRGVDAAIRGAFDELKSPGMQADLDEIQRRLGQDVDPEVHQPVVFVATSIAGGSGSGMFLDVCEIVKARSNSQVFGMVYTPEVFERPDGSVDGGIAPNALMAINEISNAMWTTDLADAPVSRDRLFARAGIQTAPGRCGPHGVMLIGRKSENLTLDNPNDAYKITGRALAEVALNGPLASGVINFTVTNAAGKAHSEVDRLGLGPGGNSPDRGTFGAMGFGRLTVGRDLFERYAHQRLMKCAALRLLDEHLTTRLPNDDRSDDDILRDAAQRVWPSFLQASGLSEAGNQNQVTNQLRPDTAIAADKSTFREVLMRQILANANGRTVSNELARTTAVDFYRGAAREESGLLANARRATGLQVRTWAVTIQDHLKDLIVATAATHGLPVTKALLERLRTDLAQAVNDLINTDAAHAEASGRQRASALPSPAANEPRNIRLDDRTTLMRIVNQSLGVIEAAIDHQTAKMAADVLRDLSVNLVEPWERALADADGMLRRELRPDEGIGALRVWPGETGVPSHLRPSVVEFSLDPVDNFPTDFKTVIAQSVSDVGDEVDLGVRRATTEVVRGENIPAKAQVPEPAGYPSRWVPELPEALDANTLPARASVKLRLDVDDLADRVNAWMRDDTKRIGSYLSMSLGEYLQDTDVDAGVRADRANMLVAQFSELLRAAQPLLKIAPDMHLQIHDKQHVDVNRFTSPLNVPSSLGQLREKLLGVQSALGSPNAVKFDDKPSQDMLLVSFNSTLAHAVEVASVMEPISKQWLATSSNPDFWKYRRARPLSEWVPLSPTARVDLISGWLAARFMGTAKVEAHRGHECLHVRLDEGWQRLPSRGARPTSADNQLGALLELSVIQMIEAYSARDLTVLEPIRALIRLGGECRTSKNVLSEWAEYGTGVGDDKCALVDVSLSSVAERRECLEQLIRERVESYALDADPSYYADVDFAQRQSQIEVHHETMSALEILRDAFPERSARRPR